MSNTVKGSKRLNSANTNVNSLDFYIEQKIKSTVNTAEAVTINAADAQGNASTGGRASATPLVTQTDGYNNALPTTQIFGLPVYRPQAGKAAIIMEPQPGDKAIAITMKRDSSGLEVGKNDAVRPATFRSYDQADSFLINGFLGEAPEIWLMLDPATGKIELSTKAANLEITCRDSGDILVKTGAGNVDIEATGTATIKCPEIIFDGNVRVTGNHTVEGKSHGPGGGAAVFSSGIVNESGGFANTGGISNTGGNTTSNDVTVETHTHKGVQTGGGNTGSPNEGT